MKDSWKYVSVGNNIKVLIFVLITFIFLLVPFSFSEGIIYTYAKLPIIGDGEIVEYAKISGDFFVEFIQKTEGSLPSFLYSLYNFSYQMFMVVLVADALFCIILSFLRLNVLRVIMKILSIFCGFFMIAFAAINLIYVVGYFYAAGSYAIPFLDMIKQCGVSSAFAFFILGIIYSIKQFKWFSRP